MLHLVKIVSILSFCLLASFLGVVRNCVWVPQNNSVHHFKHTHIKIIMDLFPNVPLLDTLE